MHRHSFLLAVLASADMMFQTNLCRSVLFLSLTVGGVTAYQLRRPQKRTNVVSKRRFKRLSDHEDMPPFEKRKSWLKSSRSKKISVSNVDQLRSVVLDQQLDLKQVEIRNFAEEQSLLLQNHDVLELLSDRFYSQSTPGNRQDNHTLALAMEGGGMRGCVSAGMAAAIASLGLSDAVDVIYGSSAGSVIGAYMVSRQMCMDVYVDILPAAKKKFVCKRRLVRSLAASLVDVLKSDMNRSNGIPKGHKQLPGMNISFVIDGILDQDHGIRPFDFTKFEENNKRQSLRVVSSSIDKNFNMFSKCFGDQDFFGETAVKTSDDSRHGLFACLEASMTVPGATGPPVKICNATTGEVMPCFDAFCFEPIPYRSAVEEGATHVLVLCSRPEGFQPKTQPGVYEQGVAPLYFHSHGHQKVAEFFEKGGQQYVYAEDLLLLEQGKTSASKVLVPPPKIIYGVDKTTETQRLIHDREQLWNRAHLLPIKVPLGTPELPVLEQDKQTVLAAVRGGFSAAFDILAPIVGLEMDLKGDEAARLVFPDIEDESGSSSQTMWQTQIHVPGDPIVEAPSRTISSTVLGMSGGRLDKNSHSELSHTLLQSLPGFQDGRFGHLAKGLRYASSLNAVEKSP